MGYNINEPVIVDNIIVEFLDKAVSEGLLTEESASIMLTIAKTLIISGKIKQNVTLHNKTTYTQ